HARSADLVAPHRLHAGNAGISDVLLDGGRAHHRAIARHLVGTRAHRRHAHHDRVVAVIDRLDVEHRDLATAAGVVPGPFAARALPARGPPGGLGAGAPAPTTQIAAGGGRGGPAPSPPPIPPAGPRGPPRGPSSNTP